MKTRELFVDGDWGGHNNERSSEEKSRLDWFGHAEEGKWICCTKDAEDGSGSRSKIVRAKHRFMHVMKQRVGVTEWEKVGR